MHQYAGLFSRRLGVGFCGADDARTRALKSTADQLRTGTEEGSDQINQPEPSTCDDASRGGGIRTHDLFVPNEPSSAFGGVDDVGPTNNAWSWALVALPEFEGC
jgi:hypothetical protein